MAEPQEETLTRSLSSRGPGTELRKRLRSLEGKSVFRVRGRCLGSDATGQEQGGSG